MIGFIFVIFYFDKLFSYPLGIITLLESEMNEFMSNILADSTLM